MSAAMAEAAPPGGNSASASSPAFGGGSGPTRNPCRPRRAPAGPAGKPPRLWWRERPHAQPLRLARRQRGLGEQPLQQRSGFGRLTARAAQKEQRHGLSTADNRPEQERALAIAPLQIVYPDHERSALA